MVASDTVVGLVGAGILLVALVGVFIYESRQGGSSDDLVTEMYSAQGSGSGTQFIAQSGTPNPVTGACAPMTMCTPASTSVNLRFEGLPSPGALKYVVYLTGGGSPFKVGSLAASGNAYAIDQTTPQDNTNKNTVAVSLERGEGGATPGYVLFSFPAPGSVPSTVAPNFLGTTGNHTLAFRPVGGNVNVSATLVDIPMKAGLAYRGWLLTENESGMSYTFVGNFTHAAGHDPNATTMNGTVAGEVPGARGDYSEFLITLEAEGGAIGETPGGPAVIVSRFNEYVAATSAPPVP